MYLIGHVVKPQGVRGEIKVKSLSDIPERYSKLDTIYIDINRNIQRYSVQLVRISGGFVFLKLHGIETRDDAASLRGGDVLIRKKDLVQPAENEYFIHDLIGCRVFSAEGVLIGRLNEVLQLSSNDVWVVLDDAEKELLIPAINDVVRQVDVKNKIITITVIEGLLD